jgi:hypothetical protein
MSSFPTVVSNVSVNDVSRGILWAATTLQNGMVIAAGNLIPDTVIEERHQDELVITESPVETGSYTNDHAFDLPQELEVTYAWSVSSGKPGTDGTNARATSLNGVAYSSFLQDTYQMLLNLKQAKILIQVSTGKRDYQSMLIKGLSVNTDRETENILLARITFRQLLLAVTQTVTVTSANQQTMPSKTMPTVNAGSQSLGSAPNFNAGNPTGS